MAPLILRKAQPVPAFIPFKVLGVKMKYSVIGLTQQLMSNNAW